MIKHNLEIEERYFSADIQSLKDYSDEFRIAYENGDYYEFTMQLAKLFELCPRKAKNRLQYERLLAFLNEKGIVLKIQSRKKNFGKAGIDTEDD